MLFAAAAACAAAEEEEEAVEAAPPALPGVPMLGKEFPLTPPYPIPPKSFSSYIILELFSSSKFSYLVGLNRKNYSLLLSFSLY